MQSILQEKKIVTDRFEIKIIGRYAINKRVPIEWNLKKDEQKV